MRKLKAIDLFSGAGGLSEGFMQTGKFDFVAHVEWELPMVETLRYNLVKRWGYKPEQAKKRVIKFDIQKTEELINGNWTQETIKDYGKDNDESVIKKGINGLLKGKSIDVIIGGPPCQAYSIAGRAQDPHSMKNDYRNYLFESFVKVVDYYKPKVFVFENVPGMLSAKPGDELVIKRIYKAFADIGYEIRTPENMKKSIYSSADYQVPQDRERVIIFGVNKNIGYDLETFYVELDYLKSKKKQKTVRDAIGEMPIIRPLDKPFKKGGRNYSHEVLEKCDYTLHEARYHSLRDIEVFREWLSKDMNNISNQKKLEFYTKVSGRVSNHNKYRSLEWDKPSPTVVSHLYKDGLMFIHPDIKQLRSITVREAAILQTFPNDFEFIGSMAYCYKMIGNAVPVLFAKNIAKALVRAMEDKE